MYEKPLANRFLASFSSFVGDNRQHPYIIKLVEDCLNVFFEKHVCRYKDFEKKTVHFVGSIAHHYTDFLKTVAKRKNITVGKILSYPIEELTLYHLSSGD